MKTGKKAYQKFQRHFGYFVSRNQVQKSLNSKKIETEVFLETFVINFSF
jgi:hypothetical protein